MKLRSTLLLLLFAATVKSQDAKITVNANTVKNNISKLIYGTNIEDVNHEIYGGFYNQQIFGESFEEPATHVNYNEWRKYAGYWLAEEDYVSIIPGRHTTRDVLMNRVHKLGVEPDHSAKLIYDPLDIRDGVITGEIKFLSDKGDNAGLLFHVSDPGIGDDIFNGYEVSLKADGKKLILGKHRHDFLLLKEVDVNFTPSEWTSVKIDVVGKVIKITVNGVLALSYEDKDMIVSGKIGLRTWKSAVAFRHVAVNNTPVKLKRDEAVSYNWDVVSSGNVQGSWALDSLSAFNGSNAQMVSITGGVGRTGIANRGLNRWGIFVDKGKTLQGRLYLKGSGAVTVALESVDGLKTYATEQLSDISGEWKKYSFSLTPSETDTNARFVVYIKDKGKIWIDQVVLASSGLPVREDIGKAIVDEGVTFMRYAGTMVNAGGYRFKNMTGDPDKRPPYKGHWNEYSTNGFGIEEAVQFASANGIVPAIAINIYETPEDAADMIEYLNGDVSSKMGRLRAVNGHPAPYHVRYIEIGNEEVIFNGDNTDDYKHYIDRFNLLYDAMHAKDTSVKFIHAAWWRPESPNMEMVFKALNGKADYWDLHVGGDDPDAGIETSKQLDGMRRLFNRIDPDTKMKVAVFEENGSKHGIQRALGHATNMNAIRRAGDFVLTSSPANALEPYLQNDNDWNQGQIFFTNNKVWGMPPFYSQQMQSLNHLPSRVEDITEGGLDVTATRGEKVLVLHVVNTSDTTKVTAIQLNDFAERKAAVKVYTLSGPLNGVNPVDKPELYKTVKTVVNLKGKEMKYSFPARSCVILRFEN